ncbi:hypothetical protein [Clostridium weizhouense]|uniref:hypothetical protein n=1 Tax=Clostridium weizhouense TaxID=2859781 RepID=UPI0027E3C0CA|nr:hypothetical protein [Clostridium weizhouense]
MDLIKKLVKKNKLSNYSIELIDDKLLLKAEGMFSKEDAETCINDTINIFKELNTSEFILVIDNIGLKMGFPDTKKLYDVLANIYLETKFKRKYILMPKNDIAGVQIKKSNNRFFNEVKIISNINEAL